MWCINLHAILPTAGSPSTLTNSDTGGYLDRIFDNACIFFDLLHDDLVFFPLR